MANAIKTEKEKLGKAVFEGVENYDLLTLRKNEKSANLIR